MDGGREMKGGICLDYSKKTAHECREDYERNGKTIIINDGKVSAGDTEDDSDGGMCILRRELRPWGTCSGGLPRVPGRRMEKERKCCTFGKVGRQQLLEDGVGGMEWIQLRFR